MKEDIVPQASACIYNPTYKLKPVVLFATKFTLSILFSMNLLSKTYAQNLSHKLYDAHDNFREKTITKRRFGYQVLMSRIDSLKQNKLFDVSVATKSSEGRDIYLIKCGTGKTKVMLWSQMHGDEPTATMAIVSGMPMSAAMRAMAWSTMAACCRRLRSGCGRDW